MGKRLKGKLALNKVTVAQLNDAEMNSVKGGTLELILEISDLYCHYTDALVESVRESCWWFCAGVEFPKDTWNSYKICKI